MIRPDFLTSPLDWTRASRTGQTRTDYACAVQHTDRPASWHPAELVFVVLFAVYLVFLFVGA